jgi:toxin FitB
MSFLLDTNVVSEMRRVERLDRRVQAWMSGIPASDMFLSVVTVMELEVGTRQRLRRDPDQGRMFRTWVDTRVLPLFAGRILPFDLDVAQRCAPLHVPDRRPDRDAMIAATALVHRLTVVTRNVVDFAPMGVPVLNPWEG